jgi:hypothetical protein
MREWGGWEGWCSQPVFRLSCSQSADPVGRRSKTKVLCKTLVYKLYFITLSLRLMEQQILATSGLFSYTPCTCLVAYTQNLAQTNTHSNNPPTVAKSLASTTQKLSSWQQHTYLPQYLVHNSNWVLDGPFKRSQQRSRQSQPGGHEFESLPGHNLVC